MASVALATTPRAGAADDSPQKTPRSNKNFGASGGDEMTIGQSLAKVIKPTAASSAAHVRRHIAGQTTVGETQRDVDEKTGTLLLYSSMDSLLQWVPKMPHDKAVIWARMPIFVMRLYMNREVWEKSNREYREQVFPKGIDLSAAIEWWRKRMGKEGAGFASFEGGFDTTGRVTLTDAPLVHVDAASGEVIADSEQEIARKRELHNRRRRQSERWSSKGHSEETCMKIEAAERLARERKLKFGQEYKLHHGWVAPKDLGEVAGRERDVKRSNNLKIQSIKLKYGPGGYGGAFSAVGALTAGEGQGALSAR